MLRVIDMSDFGPRDTPGWRTEYMRRRRAHYRSTDAGREHMKNEYRAACIKRMENKAFVIGALGGKCSVCGGEFPIECYDLHHTDPSKKENVPASIAYDLEKLWAEVREGVSVVCSNCHRTLHRKH